MTKIQLTKRVGAMAIALLMFGGFSLSSSAVLIDSSSELAFFGTYAPTGGVDLATATGLSFPNPLVIAAGAGDFAFAAGSNAAFMSFDYSPPALGTILTFAGGGSFTATSVAIDVQSATALDLTLDGFWSLAGFDDTAGNLIVTADALGGLFTVSASGTVRPVPVPGALILFASALAGLGISRRRTA